MSNVSLNLLAAMDDIFKEFQRSVELRTITTSRDSDDDVTESHTSVTTYGVVMPAEDFYTEEDIGRYESGTLICVLNAV